MERKNIFFVCLMTVFASLFSLNYNSWAQISPGKLAEPHKNLEGIKNCIHCHELGEAPVKDKCFECHSAIKDRNSGKTGYHGSGEVKEKKCSSCHSEHHGSEFQLIYWENGEENFNHSLTGYELLGRHKISDCRKCHRKNFLGDSVKSDKNVRVEKTFLGLNQDCLNCHSDEHRGQLSVKCLDCHIMDGWLPPQKFNHDNTAYKLTGKHLNTECKKCHAQKSVSGAADKNKIQKRERQEFYSQFKNLKYDNCTSCHKDVHNGKLGNYCSECHTTEGFKKKNKADFNHSLTKFQLIGKHQDTACEKCHKSGNYVEPVKHDFCSDCHIDYHAGQFLDRADKGECNSCHSEQGFQPARYDMPDHQKSGYILSGSHFAVPCNLCHVQLTGKSGNYYTKYDFSDKTCAGCHKDIHEGQVDRWKTKDGCEYCHVTDSWRKVKFDHNLSAFKLAGKHEVLECGKCHARSKGESQVKATVLKPLDMRCTGCHTDIHYGQFVSVGDDKSSICEKCHEAVDWKQLKFTHNLDSRYKLDGAHEKLNCRQCHKMTKNDQGVEYVLYKPLGTECVDCHGGNIKRETNKN